MSSAIKNSFPLTLLFPSTDDLGGHKDGRVRQEAGEGKGTPPKQQASAVNEQDPALDRTVCCSLDLMVG